MKTLADQSGSADARTRRRRDGELAVSIRGRSVYMKVNAELQIQVLGKKVAFLAPEEAKLTSNVDYPKDWEMWKRKVMGQRA